MWDEQRCLSTPVLPKLPRKGWVLHQAKLIVEFSQFCMSPSFLSLINWNHGLKVERWMSPIVGEPDWKLIHILSKWLRWLWIYIRPDSSFWFSKHTCWGSQDKTPNARLSSLFKYFKSATLHTFCLRLSARAMQYLLKKCRHLTENRAIGKKKGFCLTRQGIIFIIICSPIIKSVNRGLTLWKNKQQQQKVSDRLHLDITNLYFTKCFVVQFLQKFIQQEEEKFGGGLECLQCNLTGGIISGTTY